jgi:hypothetical protein
MAQTTILSPDHIGAAFVCEETAFTTPDTFVRMHPVAGSIETAAMQPGIARAQLAPRAWNAMPTVDGYKEGTVSFAHYLQPTSAVLDHSTSVPSAANNPLNIILRALFGGVSVAQGSLVATATSGSAFTVTTGQGSRFPAGQIILVDDPTDGIVPARVQTRSTDDLTIWPSMSGAGTIGDEVINTYTWYPTTSNTRSLAVALAAVGNSSLQWQWLGGTGDLELTFDRAQLAQCKVTGKFASWSGPSNLSLSTAVVSDPMGPPFAVRNAKLFLQAASTTSRTCYLVDSLKITIRLGMTHLETLTCGTEGRRGTFRAEGLTEAFAEMDCEVPIDTALDTFWSDKTELSAMLAIPADTSTGRRYITADAARCIIVDKPALKKGAGNLATYAFKLRCMLDDITSDTAELGTAPFRLSIG